MTRAAAALVVLATMAVLSACGPSTDPPRASSGLEELSGIEHDLDAVAREFDVPD